MSIDDFLSEQSARLEPEIEFDFSVLTYDDLSMMFSLTKIDFSVARDSFFDIVERTTQASIDSANIMSQEFMTLWQNEFVAYVKTNPESLAEIIKNGE